MGHRGFVGVEGGVQHRNLRRVDAQLAAKAHAPRALGVTDHALGIARVHRHAVNGCGQPCAARGEHQGHAHGQQFFLGITAGHAGIDLEVQVPEGQARHLRRGGQGIGCCQTGHAFHQRHHGRLRPGGPGHGLQRGCLLGLGHHGASQALRRELCQGLQVSGKPGRALAVDAHQQARTRRTFQRGHDFGQGVAGALLVGGSHGVLPVGDHHVRSTGQSLGQPLGLGGGNEQEGAGVAHRV